MIFPTPFSISKAWFIFIIISILGWWKWGPIIRWPETKNCYSKGHIEEIKGAFAWWSKQCLGLRIRVAHPRSPSEGYQRGNNHNSCSPSFHNQRSGQDCSYERWGSGGVREPWQSHGFKSKWLVCLPSSSRDWSQCLCLILIIWACNIIVNMQQFWHNTMAKINWI